ncbi:MAG: hypothetical protein PVSMB4_04230 [Ktedonobacterales bacterium]
MQCPQCDAEVPDGAWNCSICSVNLYWASQHQAELTHLRERQGLSTPPSTPPFLRNVHKRALDERAAHGGNTENKVRAIARRVMRGESEALP